MKISFCYAQLIFRLLNRRAVAYQLICVCYHCLNKNRPTLLKKDNRKYQVCVVKVTVKIRTVNTVFPLNNGAPRSSSESGFEPMLLKK